MTSKISLLATDLQAFGTDDKKALVHLLPKVCYLQKQLPENAVKDIIYDIFATSTEKGLIHASD